jgi:hypothetical protein
LTSATGLQKELEELRQFQKDLIKKSDYMKEGKKKNFTQVYEKTLKDLQNENEALKKGQESQFTKSKVLHLVSVLQEKDSEIENLKDSVSFYESMTHVKMLKVRQDGTVECESTNGKNAFLTFTLTSDPETEGNIIYDPVEYSTISNNQRRQSEFPKERDYLSRTISFKEQKFPDFLQRLHFTLKLIKEDAKKNKSF